MTKDTQGVPEGHVVVTWDQDYTRILAVTRQDDDGHILSVIAEAPVYDVQPKGNDKADEQRLDWLCEEAEFTCDGPSCKFHGAQATAVAHRLKAEDVQWIVNDLAELGVMIHGQAFFLYKGDSLVYKDGAHDDGRPMRYRPVFKCEFGECAHPINYENPKLIGTVSPDDSDEWRDLPPAQPPLQRKEGA